MVKQKGSIMSKLTVVETKVRESDGRYALLLNSSAALKRAEKADRAKEQRRKELAIEFPELGDDAIFLFA